MDVNEGGRTWTSEKTPVNQRIPLPSQPQMDPIRESFPPASFNHLSTQGANFVEVEAPATSPLGSDRRPVVVDLLIPVRPTPPPAQVENPTVPQQSLKLGSCANHGICVSRLAQGSSQRIPRGRRIGKHFECVDEFACELVEHGANVVF